MKNDSIKGSNSHINQSKLNDKSKMNSFEVTLDLANLTTSQLNKNRLNETLLTLSSGSKMKFNETSKSS